MIPLGVNWHDLLLRAVITFNEFVIYYFLTLNTVYLILFLVSLLEVVRFVRRTFFSDYQQILKSEMTWPISILVPAHNEERGIVDTVRSLLQLNYGEFEVLVVNDGSQDATLDRLIRDFDLRKTDRRRRSCQFTASGIMPSPPGSAGSGRAARGPSPGRGGRRSG